MITSFDLIGIYLSDDNAWDKFFKIVETKGVLTKTPHRDYIVVKDAFGAEVWCGQNQDGDVITLNPVFTSGLKTEVTFDVVYPDKEYGEYEANLAVTIFDGEMITRAQVTTANAPSIVGSKTGKGFLGFKRKKHITLDETVSEKTFIEITVFSMETELFQSEAAFIDMQKNLGDDALKMASKSFIPSGMFADPPEPEGFGSGKIIQCSKANGLGGLPYYWAQVEHVGTAFNVVWLYESTDKPQKGNILSFAGKLMAKI